MIIKRFWKTLLWASLILLICAMPSSEVDKLPLIPIPHFDKIVHFVLYFVLSATMIWEYSKNKELKTSNKLIYIWVGLLAFTYGVGVEILQGTVLTSRSASWSDILANGAGTAIAIISYPQLKSLAKRFRDKFLFMKVSKNI